MMNTSQVQMSAAMPAKFSQPAWGLTQKLFAAVKCDDLQQLYSALVLGAPVNAVDENGWTALHYAAAKNCAGTAGILINSGAPLEARTISRFEMGDAWPSLTPLQVAVRLGSPDVAMLLIEAGADVSCVDAPYQSAHLVANTTAALQALPQIPLQQQVPRWQENYKYPQAMYNVGGESVQTSDEWVTPRSAPDSPTTPQPAVADPLMTGYVSEAMSLMQTRQGAENMLMVGLSAPPATQAIGGGKLAPTIVIPTSTEDWVDSKHKDFMSARMASPKSLLSAISPNSPLSPYGCKTEDLKQAVMQNNMEQLGLLLDWGVTVDTPDENGWTALHWAASKNSVEAINRLLLAGANIEAKTTEKVNLNGSVWAESTPLHIAAGFQSTEVARVLLDSGANPGACDALGGTPLHSACFWGNAEIVQALIHAGADVTAITNSKSSSSPLHYAARQGHALVAEILIGAFLARGMRMLSMPTVDMFVNAKNSNKQTALHLAAFGGHVRVVEMLLRSGADKGIKNKSGKVPGQLICRGASDSIVPKELEEVKQHLRAILS